MRCRVDLATKANPCLQIEEQARARKNATEFAESLDYITKLGVSQTDERQQFDDILNLSKTPNPNMCSSYWLYSLRGVQVSQFASLRSPNMLQGPNNPKDGDAGPWQILNAELFDDSHLIRWNLDLKLKPLDILWNYLSIHMWIVKNGVRMWSGHPFYHRLLLESEMDSNLTWIGSNLTWMPLLTS
jgi:hypothetical protein